MKRKYKEINNENIENIKNYYKNLLSKNNDILNIINNNDKIIFYNLENGLYPFEEEVMRYYKMKKPKIKTNKFLIKEYINKFELKEYKKESLILKIKNFNDYINYLDEIKYINNIYEKYLFKNFDINFIYD